MKCRCLELECEDLAVEEFADLMPSNHLAISIIVAKRLDSFSWFNVKMHFA
jgi:hypothetical protein